MHHEARRNHLRAGAPQYDRMSHRTATTSEDITLEIATIDIKNPRTPSIHDRVSSSLCIDTIGTPRQADMPARHSLEAGILNLGAYQRLLIVGKSSDQYDLPHKFQFWKTQLDTIWL